MRQHPARAGRASRRAGGAALTVSVLAAALLLNLLVSLAADRRLWQADESVAKNQRTVGWRDREQRRPITRNIPMYTPTEAFLSVVRDHVAPAAARVNEARAAKGEEPLRVRVVFCAERDLVQASERLRYVQHTVRFLKRTFPDLFEISYVNVRQNPSAVQRYKATSASHIYPSQVVIAFGNEFRVCSAGYFFRVAEETGKDFAYDGEQRLAVVLLAVTRAEAPVACFTSNHGENLSGCAVLRRLVERAGYETRDIDLERDEIPEDCRLIVTYDPRSDFYGFGHEGGTGRSEIDRLDRFLDGSCSLLLFVGDATPPMPLLDEYLQEWGVRIGRVTAKDGRTDNYAVRDRTQRLDAEGRVPFGVYAQGGSGAAVTADMRKVACPAKVVFPDATALLLSDSYRLTDREPQPGEKDEVAFRFGSYYRNGVSRYLHDVFLTTADAEAEAFGERYEIATERNPFRLMTLTTEGRTIREDNYHYERDPSLVCVCGSVGFASDTVLDSAAYGNADVLLSLLHTMSREVVPAEIEFKVLKAYGVDERYGRISRRTAAATTACLTILPVAALAAAGVVTTVRRKRR